RRRAVRIRFVPPAANCAANAKPIPALAPVTSAHFPRQRSIAVLHRRTNKTGIIPKLGPAVSLHLPCEAIHLVHPRAPKKSRSYGRERTNFGAADKFRRSGGV